MSDATEPATATRTVTLDSREEAVLLFGPRDMHLRAIRDGLGVRVVARGDTLQLDGNRRATRQGRARLPADARGAAEE